MNSSRTHFVIHVLWGKLPYITNNLTDWLTDNFDYKNDSLLTAVSFPRAYTFSMYWTIYFT
jgi:hypothetical protein